MSQEQRLEELLRKAGKSKDQLPQGLVEQTVHRVKTTVQPHSRKRIFFPRNVTRNVGTVVGLCALLAFSLISTLTAISWITSSASSPIEFDGVAGYLNSWQDSVRNMDSSNGYLEIVGIVIALFSMGLWLVLKRKMMFKWSLIDSFRHWIGGIKLTKKKMLIVAGILIALLLVVAAYPRSKNEVRRVELSDREFDNLLPVSEETIDWRFAYKFTFADDPEVVTLWADHYHNGEFVETVISHTLDDSLGDFQWLFTTTPTPLSYTYNEDAEYTWHYVITGESNEAAQYRKSIIIPVVKNFSSVNPLDKHPLNSGEKLLMAIIGHGEVPLNLVIEDAYKNSNTLNTILEVVDDVYLFYAQIDY